MSIPFDPTCPSDESRTVLEEPAPAFSTKRAEEVAQQAFDLRASAHPLESERDQNFHLRAQDGSEWVLKIANPAENPALLDMQTHALLHIAKADPELSVPRVRATTDGVSFREVEGEDGRRFIVRVLSFLPGELLENVAPRPALLGEVGAMTARLARALRGFSHPSSRHPLLWDLTQAPGLRERTHHIENSNTRRLVEAVLDHFAADVLPRLESLRAQVIHNDVSTMNTLVEGETVSGVIDFGDLIHAPLVCDLAVPIAELLVEHPDPLGAAAQITAGYHSVTPLEDEERQLIPDLTATRCAMYVSVAHWRVRDHPENAAYIMGGVEDSAVLLDQLQEWGSRRMFEALSRGCGVTP